MWRYTALYQKRAYSSIWGVLVALLLCGPGVHASSYTWVGTDGSDSWSNASNWEPARTPAADDVLIFDGSRTPTASVSIDFASPQTIGQLRFVNNVVALLMVRPDAAATATIPARQLNLAGNLAGADFEITTGSSVQVRSPDGARSTAGLTFQLGLSQTASIRGTLIFGSNSTASVTNDPHRLICLQRDSKAIQFAAGSLFKAEATFTGFAFNDKAASTNTVTFQTGSTYNHRGGSAPFGRDAPNSITLLEKGSRYIYSDATTGPQLSGRTYGSLEYNRSGTISGTFGVQPLVILNDLTITTGDVKLNVAEVNIQGNININGGSLANSTAASTIALNGETAQFIKTVATNPVPVLFGTSITLAINNPAGVTLQTPLQVAGELTLIKGNLITSAAAPLTLAANATISATEYSFIVGPLTRIVAAGGSTTLDFPIGSGSAFRPLTLTVNHSDGAEASYTAEQIKGKPTARLLSGEIKKVSSVRYCNVTRTSAAANFIDGFIRLSYGPDDEVDNVEKLRIAKSSADNQTWSDLGGAGAGIVTGTITSSIPFTGFSTFALASTDAGPQPGSNPLPVELISFSAERRAQGVLLRWATASEKNNAGFEVERSSDGRVFETVGNVKGQGQSAQKQAYSILDATPFSRLVAYYRVRQLDFDGMATYSNAVAVKGTLEAGLYPNPARNQLTFCLPYNAAATYRILTSTGHTLQKGPASGASTTLDIAGLPAGFYYLEIETATDRIVRKFIKQAE